MSKKGFIGGGSQLWIGGRYTFKQCPVNFLVLGGVDPISIQLYSSLPWQTLSLAYRSVWDSRYLNNFHDITGTCNNLPPKIHNMCFPAVSRLNVWTPLPPQCWIQLFHNSPSPAFFVIRLMHSPKSKTWFNHFICLWLNWYVDIYIIYICVSFFSPETILSTSMICYDQVWYVLLCVSPHHTILCYWIPTREGGGEGWLFWNLIL